MFYLRPADLLIPLGRLLTVGLQETAEVAVEGVVEHKALAGAVGEGASHLDDAGVGHRVQHARFVFELVNRWSLMEV